MTSAAGEVVGRSQSRYGPARRGREHAARRIRTVGPTAPCGMAVRGSSGPSVSRRSRNSWRAVVVVADPVEQRVEQGVDVVGANVDGSLGQAGPAASVRVSAVSGIRASRRAPPRCRPGRPAVRPVPTTAPGWSGSRSSAWRSDASSPLADEEVGLARRRGQPGDELGDLGLGERADEPVDHLGVAQRVHRRDRLDLEAGRHLGVLVDVDLDQLDGPVGGGRPPAR